MYGLGTKVLFGHSPSPSKGKPGQRVKIYQQQHVTETYFTHLLNDLYGISQWEGSEKNLFATLTFKAVTPTLFVNIITYLALLKADDIVAVACMFQQR